MVLFYLIIGFILILFALTNGASFFIVLIGVVLEYFVLKNAASIPLSLTLIRYIIPIATLYLAVTVASDDD